MIDDPISVANNRVARRMFSTQLKINKMLIGNSQWTSKTPQLQTSIPNAFDKKSLSISPQPQSSKQIPKQRMRFGSASDLIMKRRRQ